MKIDIKSLNMQELALQFKALGEPSFRAKQVFIWLHKGAASFHEMTNLSKPLRETLSARYFITVPTVERGLRFVDFWSMEIAGESPSMLSTSGFSIWPKN